MNLALIVFMRRAITKTEALIVAEMKKTFQQRQEKNPRYSLRAYARSLEIEASNLSEILSGKRALSIFVAEKILKHLDCSREQQDAMMNDFKVELDQAKRFRKQSSNEYLVEEEGFNEIATWYHMAILTFFETPHYDGTVQSVAKYFGMETDKVQSALDGLVKMGLLRLENGKYEKVAATYRAPKENPEKKQRVGSDQIVADSMDLAADLFTHYTYEEKEVWAAYMALNPARMSEARTYYREGVTKFLSSFSCTPGEESDVYQISFQMVPLKNAGTLFDK